MKRYELKPGEKHEGCHMHEDGAEVLVHVIGVRSSVFPQVTCWVHVKEPEKGGRLVFERTDGVRDVRAMDGNAVVWWNDGRRHGAEGFGGGMERVVVTFFLSGVEDMLKRMKCQLEGCEGGTKDLRMMVRGGAGFCLCRSCVRKVEKGGLWSAQGRFFRTRPDGSLVSLVRGQKELMKRKREGAEGSACERCGCMDECWKFGMSVSEVSLVLCSGCSVSGGLFWVRERCWLLEKEGRAWFGSLLSVEGS